MTVLSDFITAMNGFMDRQDTAIADLQGDVKTLNDQIAALQASEGTLTQADQDALNAIQTRAGAIADKLQGLDDLTPPAPPPAA